MANEYFGKVSKSGIQIIPDVLTDVALGTLGTLTALVIGTGTKAILKNFLVKKIHILLGVINLTAGETIIVGINANDSGVSGGYAIGTLSTLLAPELSEAYLTTQEFVKTVWHETPALVQGGGNDVTVIDKWVSVGGGKGIPCMAGAGPEVHVLNPTGDSLTTGALVNGVVTYYGVWLED